ncbi:hypothetical protein SeMB42_g02824 [Synchytrium endobioticum]|uniref:Protein MON2 homolog n=1 Tax=Synchytrium endobioticum TaxID=286115 RepID=A0A507DBD0_9FUNG|nr:hypothetical protein SeMB42_g02824 [Synchytrium endobioticum]
MAAFTEARAATMASGSGGLIALLQHDLIHLSSEAKKKYPEIKDETDKALYVLRSLKDKAETESVIADLQATGDVLRPFLQSCDTKNAKLVHLAVGCIQRMIASSAIPENCIPDVLQNLTEVMNGVPELQLKVLQTILKLLTNFPNIHGTLLADALLLCFRLQITKDRIVNHAAAATLRQILIHLFEKVQAAEASGSADSGMCASDAKALFSDICNLTVGDPASFLGIATLPRNLGLELVEAVLADHADQFRMNVELNHTLRDRICPMVIKLFPEKNDFALTVRLLRIVKVIIINFQQSLVMECEIFLSILAKNLDPEVSLWHRVMILELYRTFCSDSGLLRSIFRSYDAADQSVKVFKEVINAFSRFVVADGPNLLTTKTRTSLDGTPSSSPLSGNDDCTLSGSSCSMRIPCIEQLDKADPPSIPDLYPIYLATQCLLGAIEAQASFVLPVIQLTAGPEPDPKYQADILLAIEMANTSWGAILTSFSFLMNSAMDDDLFGQIVKGFTNFASVAGLLGLASQRDAMLISLCKCCVPVPILDVKDAPRSTPAATFLSDRNLACLRALLTVTQTLASVLDENGWFVILETIQIAEGMVQSGKFGKRAASEGGLLADTPTAPLLPPHIAAALRVRSISNAVSPTAIEKIPLSVAANSESVEYHFLTLLQGTKKLLAVQSAAGSSSATPSTPVTARPTEGSTFAIAKLHDVSLQGVHHLMNRNTDGLYVVWDPLTKSLIEVIHSTSTSTSTRALACGTLQEIITAAAERCDLSHGSNEVKILETLKKLMIVIEDDPNDVDTERERALRSQTWFIEVQKAGLDTLNKLLQLSGQKLSKSWLIVFQVLASCMPPINRQKRQTRLFSDSSNGGLASTPTASVIAVETAEVAPSLTLSASKTVALVRLGFPSLQLICADFLGLLDSKSLVVCIEVVGLFASQQDDLNIALTCIGLLWSISDFVLRQKDRQVVDAEQKKEEEVESTDTAATVKAVRNNNDSGECDQQNSQKFVLEPVQKAERTVEPTLSESMWHILLKQLSQLCSDPRPEVRNGASQSLFRTVSMNGARLNLDAWKECIYHVMFPLLEHIQLSSDRAENAKTGSAFSENRGSFSGSPLIGSPTSSIVGRNATTKQWDETKVLTLQGFVKCFMDFQDVLVGLGDDFGGMWTKFLRYLKHWCFSGSMEVAMAALQSIKAILSRQHENSVMAEILWNTWCDLGLGILEVKEASDPEAASPVEGGQPTIVNDHSCWRSPSIGIVQGFFSQDVLQQYAYIFPDIYRPMKSRFVAADIHRILDILAGIIMYHSRPIPGTSISRLKADMINDLENPTQLQITVLDLINMLCDQASEMVLGEPDVCIMFLAHLISLPLAPRIVVLPGSINNLSNGATEPGKGFTYIALSRRAMQQSISLLGRFGARYEVYETKSCNKLVHELGVIMQRKYDCPEVGKRDTTPLWKTAANVCLSVSNIALDHVSEFIGAGRSHFTEFEDLFDSILTSFEVFFLGSTLPIPTITEDELSADIAFEQSLLSKFESDIIPRLTPTYVPDTCLSRFATMLQRAAKNEWNESERLVSAGGPCKVSKLRPVATSTEEVSKISPETTPVSYDRDVFSRVCFGTLCRLCSSVDDVNPRVAGVLGPVLVHSVVETTLSAFVKNQLALGSHVPIPKKCYRDLIFMLESLLHLQLYPNILLPDQEANPVKRNVLSGSSAHLFTLYPHICDVFAVVATNTNSIFSEHSDLIKLLRQCLATIGKAFAL